MPASAEPATCRNCGTPAEGRYCPTCGQDNRLERLDLAHLSSEVVQNLVGWDTALVHTLRGLLTAPGALVREFVAGRRRRFVNPARFCLLSMALWFLVTRLLLIDPMVASGIRITGSSGGEVAKVVEEVRDFIARHLDLLLFLALPLRAVLLRVFFRAAGRNVAECLVMVLYVTGLGFLFGTLLAPFSLLDVTWPARVRPLLTLVWSYWTALGFFGRGWFPTLWRLSLVSFLHVIGTFLFFGIVAVPWVLLTRG